MKKIVGLTIVSLLLLSACQKDAEPATSESTPPDVISEKTGEKLELRDSEIFAISAEGEKKLFTNVSKVEAMRMGPDGKTIHFKVTQPRRGEDRAAHCANLEAQIRPSVDAGNPNPPPTQAPWDFQRIANAYTIEGCGTYGEAGGYLDTGDFFAYLKEAKSKDLVLVVEALADASTVSIEFPKGSSLTGLDEITEDEDFGVAGFVNAEGERFFYPQEDAVLKDGLLVLAFGEKIVAVDIKAKKLIGTEYLTNPPYSIIAFSFWFHSKPNLPFVVVESGWEGQSGFSVMLDIENGALYTHRLEKLAQANTNGYQAEFLQWDDQGLTLNFYKEVDITDQAMKNADPEVAQVMKGIEKSYSEADWNALEKKLDDVEAKERATGKYVDVLCQFPGMAGGGCMGLTKGTTYRVTPGSGLKELK